MNVETRQPRRRNRRLAPAGPHTQAGASWKPIDDHSATVVLPGPDGPVDVDLTIAGAGTVGWGHADTMGAVGSPAAHLGKGSRR